MGDTLTPAASAAEYVALLQRAWEQWSRADGQQREKKAERILSLLANNIAFWSRIKARPPLAESADLAQAARIAVFEALPRYNPAESCFFVYIHATIRQAIMAAVVESGAFEDTVYLEDLKEDIPQLAIDWHEDAERRDIIERNLLRLPLQWQQVLRFRLWYDYTQQETGDAMSVSRERVKAIEHQALRRLQDLIGPEGAA